MKYAQKDGWELHKISDIADVNPGKSKAVKREDNELTSFIPMETVDEVNGKITAYETRTYGEVKKGYTYFENGDIIFAKITPCMQNGKSAIVENLIGGIGYGSTEFIVIRAKPGISNKWILHFLRTAELRKDAEDHFTGSAGQQRVSTDFISDCKIPYPVDHNKVDKLLSELDEAINRSMQMQGAAQKQEEAVNALQDSILREVLPSGKDKLPSDWEISHIGDGKYTDLIMGQSPPGETYNKNKVGLPFYQGKTDFGELNPTPSVWCGSPKKIAIEKDILLTVRAPVGSTNVATEKCCIGRGIAAIRCKEGLDYKYFLWVLKKFELELSKQGSGSIFNAIGKDEIKKIFFPMPLSKEEQIKISMKITDKVDIVNKSQKSIKRQLEAIELLPSAILRQTFAFN